MRLATEGQIETNEQMLSDCSSDDAAMINSDASLTSQQKFAAMMDPDEYKFKKNNPYIQKDAANYPALFKNVSNPNDFIISRKYQSEFQEYEDQLKNSGRTQGAIENAWNSFWLSRAEMQKNDLVSELMDARKEDDTEKIKELETKIAEKEADIAEMTPPSRMGASGTLGAVVGSFSRLAPELVLTGVATAALSAASPVSGGATAAGAAVTAGKFALTLSKLKKAYTAYKASRAASLVAGGARYIQSIADAAIVYNDTVNVTRGELYEELKGEHPDWSEDDVQSLAWAGARIEGFAEVGTSLIGMSGAAARTSYKVARRAMFIGKAARTMGKEIGDTIEKKAIKDVLRRYVTNGIITPEMANNNSFVRKLLVGIGKFKDSKLGYAALYGADASVEAATEVFQNEVDKIIKNFDPKKEVDSVGITMDALSNIGSYISEGYEKMVTGREMSKDAQEMWETFGNVAFASGILGGAFTGIDLASKRIFRNKAQALGNQIEQANSTIKTFDTVLEQKKNSQAGQKSPETLNDFYKNAKESGELPETLYVRLDKLKEIVTKMKNDPVATAKLNAMKVSEKIEDASNDAGLVEFDTSDFIQTVVDPKNDTLYQTIKGDITANPAINSKNDIQELIENIGKSDQMIKDAVADPNSIYNMVYENQKNAGVNDALAKFNATTAQSLINTLSRATGGKINVENIMKQVNLRIENVENITDATQGLNSIASMYSADPRILNLMMTAEAMEASGKNVQDIWEATRMERDKASGKWIYEITDENARLKHVPEGKQNLVLGDVLDHPELYQIYPAAALIPLKLGKQSQVNEKGIELNNTLSDEDKLRSLLHEIVHVIEWVEELARGGNPRDYKPTTRKGQKTKAAINYFSDLRKEYNLAYPDEQIPNYVYDYFIAEKLKSNKNKLDAALKHSGKESKLKDFDKNFDTLKEYFMGTTFGQYWRTYGEDMARTVAGARLKMSEAERIKTPLSQSMEFKHEDQIVRFDRGLTPQFIEDIRKGSALYNRSNVQTQVSKDVEHIVGQIQFGTETIIRMSKLHNPTTFAHEGAHLFSHFLFDNYNSGLLTEHWQKNTEKLADFFGFKKDENGKYVFTGESARGANEKFAEAFTSYLKTGKAPASYLKELFDMVKEWFSNVYSMLRMNEVPLDRKITKVFDEIFVPYEKQKQILIERRYGFLPKPENMTDEQYERYVSAKRAEASHGQTEETKLAAKLQEVMSNETYKAEYEDAYRQAYDDLAALSVYQMIDYVIQEKINSQSLKNILPDTLLPRNYVSAKDGLDITQVYAQFKDLAATPEDLVKILSETPSRESAANYAAKEHMKEWLQENYPEVAEIDSELAARNEQAFKLSVLEYMMLSGIGMERFNQIHNDMLSIAEYMVQRMPLKKIANVQRWIEQENKIMQKYDYTLSDKEKAKIKRQQAFLNYYAMRSKQIRQESQKFIKHSRKYRGPQTKEVLRTIDGETFDLLKAMLGKFKFTNAQPNSNIPMGARIEQWVEMMHQNNYNGADEISKYTADIIRGVENKATTADFELLKEAFGFVESIGKKQKMIDLEGKAILVENAAVAVADEFVKAGIKPMDTELGIGTMREAVFRELFPKDVFLDYFSPIFKGLTRKDMQIQTWRNQLADILKPLGKDLQEKYQIDGRYFTKEQLLVMMLNSGNVHNINCMVKTMQAQMNDLEFTADSMFSILEQAPKELREATRKIWQIFEDNKQSFQDVQRKIDGKVLKFVEAQPYTFSDGEQMPGGYYPAGKVSQIKDYASNNANFSSNGVFATKSFQHDRVITHGDLDLTLGTLNAWFYQMAGVLHVAVPYNNLGKLLRNGTFRNAVGPGMVTTISKWLDMSNSPERVNKYLSAINQLVSVQVLGLNPLKTFTQMSGMIPAMAKIGVGNIAEALISTNPITAVKEAATLSEYMKARYEHPEDHLQLYMRSNDLFGKSIDKLNSTEFNKVLNMSMFFIVYGDAIASTVTWKAEYNKQRQLGLTHNQASDLADSSVRLLQGDTSAGSRPPLLQGNMRFFTMFSSYFIGIHSMLVANKIKGNYGQMAGLLFAAAVAAPMFEALINTAKDWMFASDDDKKKWDKDNINNVFDLYLKQSIGNILSSAGSFWLPHFGLGATLGTTLATGKVYKPRNMQIEYMLKPIETGIDVIQYAKLKSEGQDKKSQQKAKKILKNVFPFGMINLNVIDRVNSLITGD